MYARIGVTTAVVFFSSINGENIKYLVSMG